MLNCCGYPCILCCIYNVSSTNYVVVVVAGVVFSFICSFQSSSLPVWYNKRPTCNSIVLVRTLSLSHMLASACPILYRAFVLLHWILMTHSFLLRIQ